MFFTFYRPLTALCRITHYRWGLGACEHSDCPIEVWIFTRFLHSFIFDSTGFNEQVLTAIQTTLAAQGS